MSGYVLRGEAPCPLTLLVFRFEFSPQLLRAFSCVKRAELLRIQIKSSSKHCSRRARDMQAGDMYKAKSDIQAQDRLLF